MLLKVIHLGGGYRQDKLEILSRVLVFRDLKLLTMSKSSQHLAFALVSMSDQQKERENCENKGNSHTKPTAREKMQTMHAGDNKPSKKYMTLVDHSGLSQNDVSDFLAN